MLSRRSTSIYNILYNIAKTHFTAGKALFQNQRAGGPGGSGMPFLSNESFLYKATSTATTATMPAAQLALLVRAFSVQIMWYGLE